ncbi:MAG: SMP-30/gluconolactonase/LRE family protein [Parvularculaceae bacterium]|jgi:arylesterase/paraoxonase|nr:SMP-30/gluconolactonase/LRE family protein [Parvularculaceae bacterium]
MRLFGWIIGAAALAAAAYFLSVIIPVSGMLRPLNDQLVDRCRPVTVFPGAEDVTIDPDSNLAFVSADDRRARFAGKEVQGGIYAFDVDSPDVVTKVSPDNFGPFHPHGISLWRGDGQKRLFAINHAPDGEKVEIFDVGPAGALTHLESVAFAAMHSPNDILGVGPRAFYATNDRGYKTGILSTLEAWLALPFASLVYFDGENGRKIVEGLVFANGVNQTPDGTALYVAEFLKRRINVYTRNPQSGALTLKKRLKVKTNPDNIEVARDGGLWVGGHPRVFDFLKHVKDPAHPAPSEVVRIYPHTGENKVFFVDTKGRLNASSVGAVWDETLIVGSVFDDRVMVCPMVKIFLENAGQNS